MFRIAGPGGNDPAQERRNVREAVKSNLIAFVAICTVLRITPVLLAKISS